MTRIILLVMDSFGVGASIDAKAYGDANADTLGHIADYCETQRGKPLALPHLDQLGLGRIATASTGRQLPGFDPQTEIIGSYGYAVEQSVGKDTPSGHWEMMGLPVMEMWHIFNDKHHAMDQDMLSQIATRGQIPGFLGNRHASGTEIIETLGEESIQTGCPIIYTSADSVIQIAAHENAFGLERLYQLCEITRHFADDLNVARVIARPFIGEPGQFTRTPNRRDYSTPPFAKTCLDHLLEKDIPVLAIGKISDIFAGVGISQSFKGKDNMDLFDTTLEVMNNNQDDALIFTNFVDFDSHYGHRRDIPGYAQALEDFDARLPELFKAMTDDDMLIISADHGCDPSFPGSDHTREHVPLMVYGPQLKPTFLGRRESFADIGQTIAEHFNTESLNTGVSFLDKLSSS